MTVEITFATWNIDSWSGGYDEKLGLLRKEQWDVLALQEVTPRMADALCDAELANQVEYPSDLYGEKFGSALLARNGVRLKNVSLIADLPRPSRGVHAHAVIEDSELRVLSWHAHHGVGAAGPQRKRAGYLGFIAWVRAQSGPLLVGTDANHGAAGSWGVREEDFPGSPMTLGSPRKEWLEECQWWIQDKPDLFDAWMEYLRAQPKVLAHLRANWTSGPSAVSYYQGKKQPRPNRFDYILMSPEFSVTDIAYSPMDERRRCAGSDHAFLRASLAMA
jgi:endonuclease/exonuclease/phosphatase family metal-dependent hydrolase